MRSPNLPKRNLRPICRSLVAAACALAPLSAVLAPAQAQQTTRPANEVVLSIGRGQLITVPGRMADIFVANDAIADVQVKSASQLYVFGKGAGETTVYASNAAGAVVWSATVRVGSNIDSVDQMLQMAMPDANVQVATMNGTVLLTGTVAAPEDAAEAERLAKAFVGANTNVVSRLRTATPLQVNLQVRIAEVSRSLVRDIGVNLASADSTSGFKFGVGQGRDFYPQHIPGAPMGTGTGASDGVTTVTPSGTGTSIFGAGKLLGLDLLGALDLGETVGLVTTLSNPNLTALSGETADFLAGGEFPIPISGGLGDISIEYRKYGVSLAYTPTVLANGRISLRVRPEVSELSTQGAVQINGFQVPALTIRRAETTVELGSGQSFMIAGLMSNAATNTLKKAPGIGDIPILGNLFRSTGFRKGETELVIVVTPYLVNPVDGRDIKYPTDGYLSANMAQQLLGNMQNDGVNGGTRPMPSAGAGLTAPNPAVGAVLPAPGMTGTAAPPREAARGSKRQPRKNAQAEAATPGFTLN